MIQTQLLKLDPPYQIISAGGHVGIQVATLIEAREIDLSQNGRISYVSPSVEYRSYPVVNYGLKEGLKEELKYNKSFGYFEELWAIRRRMQPEGAVWSGIDIKDVRILGIAGTENSAIELCDFVHLVPTAFGIDPSLHVWDENSTSRLYELYWGLGNVGLRTQNVDPTTYRLPNGEIIDTRDKYPVFLSYEHHQALNADFIKVMVKENVDDNPIEDISAYFRCQIAPESPESIGQCASTISEALNCLVMFLPSSYIDIRLEMSVDKDNRAKDINQLLRQVKNNLYFTRSHKA